MIFITLCSVFLCFQHLRHTSQGEHKAHNAEHSSLYIWINTKCFLRSTLLYVFRSFCLKKTKNCKATQFCKISFVVSIFYRFLCQRQILKGFQWILMSFWVCSVRFLVGSGKFLLWFFRKRNGPTFMRDTAIERVFLCVCVCANMIITVSSVILVSKVLYIV